ESARVLAVVSRVFVVLLERDWVFDFDRLSHDAYLDVERVKRRHKFMIEIGHRLRAQRERVRRASIRLNAKLMINEIEIYLKKALAIGDRRGRKAARGDVQGRLPPVIDHRGLREPHLADDLRPHMQRLTGILPRVERQARPDHVRKSVRKVVWRCAPTN